MQADYLKISTRKIIEKSNFTVEEIVESGIETDEAFEKEQLEQSSTEAGNLVSDGHDKIKLQNAEIERQEAKIERLRQELKVIERKSETMSRRLEQMRAQGRGKILDDILYV